MRRFERSHLAGGGGRGWVNGEWRVMVVNGLVNNNHHQKLFSSSEVASDRVASDRITSRLRSALCASIELLMLQGLSIMVR